MKNKKNKKHKGKDLRPYCCPVCRGKGVLPSGFYKIDGAIGVDTNYQFCRSCNGTGIVWS